MRAVGDPDGLRQALRVALTTAMKARDATAVRALRATLGAIDNAEAVDEDRAPRRQHGVIAGGVAGLGAGEVRRRELTAAEVAGIVRTEIADRTSAADEYDRLGRPDRAARLRAEAAVLTARLDGLDGGDGVDGLDG